MAGEGAAKMLGSDLRSTAAHGVHGPPGTMIGKGGPTTPWAAKMLGSDSRSTAAHGVHGPPGTVIGNSGLSGCSRGFPVQSEATPNVTA